MKKQRTIELLQSIMSGDQLGPELIDELIRDRVSEDLHLDYKHGSALTSKSASTMVREYVSAFANSDGGVLIIGIDAPPNGPWSVAGCAAQGNGNLTEWATRCLTSMIASFAPPPRFLEIRHPHGDVLLIATERAPRLVAHTVGGDLVYQLRLHDQTIKAEPYLITDLVLGRRQHPDLAVSVSVPHAPDIVITGATKNIQVQYSFKLTNDGPSWAPDVTVGLIAWSPDDVGDKLSGRLLSHVDAEKPGKYPRVSLRHMKLIPQTRTGDSTLGPFGSAVFTPAASFSSAVFVEDNFTILTALYIIPRGSPPVWYQVSIPVRAHPRGAAHNSITVTPTWTSRPRVTWVW